MCAGPGTGTYFAVNARYSTHQRYVGAAAAAAAALGAPAAPSQTAILLCLVAVGESQLGKQGMRHCDFQPDGKSVYDTTYGTHGVAGGPALEYCVFDDAQAYPLYKITYQ